MTMANSKLSDSNPANLSADLNDEQSIELSAGTLAGILSWDDLDQIWNTLTQSNDDWYLYRPDTSKPGRLKIDEDIQASIKLLDQYLREAHPRDYCGIVYADSISSPSLIRVFDPKYLTSMCNIYGNTPAPDWVFSKTPPTLMLTSNEASPKLEGYSLGKTLPATPDHPRATDTLDARRMGCPLPLIHTARSLKRLALGEILEIVSIDPGAVNDIEYLCECTGSKHLAITEGDYGYSFYLLRM